MNDKMTLVERLRNPAYVSIGPGEAALDKTAALATMTEAADRIEYLERMAGAVTQGESFQEIKDRAR